MSQANTIRAAEVRCIDLGYRLNHLLDRSTSLGKSKKGAAGLVLPSETEIGSGMVVVVGDPGSGKSTLGLQIAVAAAEQGVDSAYISLEEDRARIEKKATIFGWETALYCPKLADECIWPARSGGDSDVGCAKAEPAVLRAMLEEARGGARSTGKVLLPGLLPRPVSRGEARMSAFAWDQYRQIECIVRSAAAHNREAASDKDDPTGIRIVVIDSLDMLGFERGNRELFFRLFDLFRRHAILGVFTAESETDEGFDSTMGDVVLKFTKDRDAGYEVTFIECVKSRFYKRTLGRQSYKIMPLSQGAEPMRGEVGVVVLPSLHAVVAATQVGPSGEREIPPPVAGNGESDEGFPIGWGDRMTEHLVGSKLHRSDVVTLVGPPGTLKTQVALNFLLQGVVGNETVLFLRMRSPEEFEWDAFRPFAQRMIFPEEEGRQEQGRADDEENRGKVAGLARRKRETKEPKPEELVRTGWAGKFTARVHGCSKEKGMSDGRLVVVDFPTGMLQPEEFVDIIWFVLERYAEKPVRRVVLDDVRAIGSSYPLLQRSISAGDHFLSYFLHVMRNRGIGVLLVGTTGEFAESNAMVHQACSLADAILRTSIGTVYGDKYVLIAGDGMAARQPNSGDTSPAVLSLKAGKDQKELQVDAALLDQYVGFETGQIYRPGIVMHMFEECGAQREYNESVLARLQDRYGRPVARSDGRTSGVRLFSFKPRSPVRGGPPLRGGAESESPRDHTSLRMVDEFELEGLNDEQRQKIALTRNVLLLAYKPEADGIEQCRNWSEISAKAAQAAETAAERRVSQAERGCEVVAYDHQAPETLACLVLDAIFAACGDKAGKTGSKPIDLRKVIGASKEKKAVRSAIAEELYAMRRAMTLRFKGRGSPGGGGSGRASPPSSTKRMPGGASVFVCWYTELRDLLRNDSKLANELRVCRLPGGGFRGDWYMRVEPGSVSMRCGDAILQSLRSASENFERFRQGIGIPVKTETDLAQHLLAWPGAPAGCCLSKATKIWDGAFCRSWVKKYQEISRVLYGIGEAVVAKVPKGGGKDPYDLAYFQDVLERLPSILRAVTS